MILSSDCYKLFRLAIANNATHCFLTYVSGVKLRLYFVCKPVIIDNYIQFILLVPSSKETSLIDKLYIYNNLVLLILLSLPLFSGLSKEFNSILNIKVKLGV